MEDHGYFGLKNEKDNFIFFLSPQISIRRGCLALAIYSESAIY